MDGANMNAQVCLYAHFCLLRKYFQSYYRARLGSIQTSNFVDSLSNFQNEISYQIVFGDLLRVYRWDLQAQVGLEQMFAI